VPLLTRFLSVNKVQIDGRKDSFFVMLGVGLSLVKNNRDASEVSEKLVTLYEEMENLLILWEEHRILLEIVNDFLLSYS
jgi:hypothetical protein